MKVTIQIPMEHWDTLIMALASMENHDNSMSGYPTERARATYDWLTENCEWVD